MRFVRFMVIAAVILMAVCVIPMDCSDASSTETAKVSGSTVYHFNGTANADVSRIDDANTFVYSEGDDASMKAYIADHSKYPDKGLTSVENGKMYDVYSTTDEAPYWLDAGMPEVVLGEYAYTLDVPEGVQWKISLDSMKYNDGEEALTIALDDGNNTQFLLKGSVTTISNMGSGHFQFRFDHSLDLQDKNALYVEITFEKDVKNLNGNPTVYVIASIAIVVLVALTIAICGRKPKF